MGEPGAGAAEPGFATRIGLALVAPFRAFALVDRAEGRAGLNDAATLLLLKFVCVEARGLVAAVWTMLSVGVMSGLGAIGPRVQAAVGMDLLLVFGGGVLLTLLAGRKRRPSRDFDLAGMAWVPYLAFQLVVSLVALAFDLHLSRATTDFLGIIAMALMATWLGLAVRYARGRQDDAR